MPLQDYQVLYLDNNIPINKSFYCNNGDLNTRGLEVHVLENAQAKDCTGLTLQLIIKIPNGDLFPADATPLTIAQGIFQIDFPNNMGKGRFVAELQLKNVGGDVLVSRKFSIVGDGSLTSDGAINAVPGLGVLWNVVQNEAVRQAAFDAVFENIEPAAAAKFAEMEVEYAEDLTEVKTSLAQTASKADTASLKADAMASGSPKGVYATLTALQTAFPTGTIGAYLVLADGKWYYWSGTAWTIGGVYQSTGIADKSINTVKTDFITLDTSANLYTGVYAKKNISGVTGAVGMSDSETGRTFICEIQPSTTYTIIKVGTSARFVLATSSALVATGSFDGALNQSLSGQVIWTFTSGANDHYLYVNVSNTSEEPFMQIAKGSRSTANAKDFRYIMDKRIIADNFKDKIRLKLTGNSLLILYPSKSGNYVGYIYGLSTNAGINLNTWRLLSIKIYDPILAELYSVCPDTFDMEGVLKITGEPDYIGSVHGDEQFSSCHLYIDGVLIGSTATTFGLSTTMEGYYDSIEFIVKSNIYHANDSVNIAFNKVKSTLFDKDGVHVNSRWKPIANTTLDHVRGSLMSIQKVNGAVNMISTYRDSVANVIPVAVPAVSGVQSDIVTNPNMVDCTLAGDKVCAKLWAVERGGSSSGKNSMITDFGDRLKPYIDCYTGETVLTGVEVYCKSRFLITTP